MEVRELVSGIDQSNQKTNINNLKHRRHSAVDSSIFPPVSGTSNQGQLGVNLSAPVTAHMLSQLTAVSTRVKYLEQARMMELR